MSMWKLGLEILEACEDGNEEDEDEDEDEDEEKDEEEDKGSRSEGGMMSGFKITVAVPNWR